MLFHPCEERGGAKVEVGFGGSASEWGTHFVGEDAVESPVGQSAPVGGIVDETLSERHGAEELAGGVVADAVGVVLERGEFDVIGIGGDDGVGSGFFGGGVEVFAAHGGGPCVEAEFAIGAIHRGEELDQRVGMDSQVVMVLDGKGDVVVRGAIAAFADEGSGLVPCEACVAAIVTGENANDGMLVQLRGEACEGVDVSDLHFNDGDFGGGEAGKIGVSADDGAGEIGEAEGRFELGDALVVGVEWGQVGTFGHEHDGVEAELRGLVDELIESQSGLSPQTGVADGKQTKLHRAPAFRNVLKVLHHVLTAMKQ